MKTNRPESVEVPVWTGHGTGMLRRRSALPPEHPESEWNYILKHYPGTNPLDYGAEPPRTVCKECGRPHEDY